MEGFDERRFQYRFFNKYERDDFKLTQYGYHRWSKETAHAPTIKDSYVLHIVLEGKGFVRVKNKQYQVLPGNAFLIRPGELIDYYSDTILRARRGYEFDNTCGRVRHAS